MTTPPKPDHEKRPFRFKLEGPFLRVSTMLLITPISPNFKGLKCSVFGRFRALQSIKIYGTIGAVELMKGETMTLTEISRYFHLNETIQKNREALKFLRERAEPAAPSLNGMPHASGVKDSTGRLAVEIADMDARITYLEEQAEQERDKAVTFCSTIQDARLYLIFRLRFVRCLTWAEVADLLGDYYTGEGVCRMAYNYLAKTEKEKPTAQSA